MHLDRLTDQYVQFWEEQSACPQELSGYVNWSRKQTVDYNDFTLGHNTCMKPIILFLLFSTSFFFNGEVIYGAVSDEEQSRLELLDAQIAGIEDEHGAFHISLFDPLMAIASEELERGNTESALDYFQRAQNISHRNEGVYSPKQLEIIRQLTNIALVEGDFEHADQQQRFSFFVERHHLDESDPQLLAAYDSMADWYMLTGQPRRARRLLQEALEIAEQRNMDTLTIATNINKSRRLEGLCCRVKQLEEALASHEAAERDTKVAAYFELADSYILAGKSEVAADLYQLAHQAAPLTSYSPPKPISSKRVMPSQRKIRGTTYKLRRDVFSNRIEPVRVWEKDLIDDEELPPQWFIVDGDQEQIGIFHPDIRTSEDAQQKAEQLVGSPLLFQESQLNNLLSRRFTKTRDQITIDLVFDVMPDGNLENIEVLSSNGPSKLNRLVTDALRRVYFRPATRDGIPIKTEGFRFVQNFKSYVREV